MNRLDHAHGVPASEDVTGVLLCGGESRRMGRDKAMLEFAGRRLIEYPLAALRGVAGTVLIASGRSPRYAEFGLRIVLDTDDDVGPLGGLLAGLTAARTKWVAVLACDMPRASSAVLSALLAEALRKDLDACLLELERGTQPMFAVYRREVCARAVRDAIARGERRMVSFHSELRLGVLRASELGPQVEGEATNVNTPDELSRLESGAARGDEERAS